MSGAPAHLSWPAERFYWAVLDGAGVARSGRGVTSRQLGYLFENVLPGIPIEDVHVIYRRAAGKGQRYVACGLSRAVLEHEVDGAALTLCPDALPEFVNADVEPSSLNLLTDAFLPQRARRTQRRWFRHGVFLLALCAVVLVIGLERRRQRAADEVARLEVARLATLESGLDRDEHAGASAALLDLELLSELRRLEQTRNDATASTAETDCSVLLANLLREWPAGVAAEMRSIVVAPDGITVRCRVPAMADVQRLVDALGAMPEWRIQQPQSQSQAGHVEVTLRLEKRAPEAAP